MIISKLKLGPIAEEKPIKVQVELPAALHHDLADYADLLGSGPIDVMRAI